MPNDLPSWLVPPKNPAKLPDWLSGAPREYNAGTIRGKPPEVQENILLQFEMAFPRLIDRLWGGETLNEVLDQFPLPVDRGAFMRWVKKDPHRFAVYKDAKEGRTEVWAGEMISVARGDDPLIDLDRAKVLISTYKWFMQTENKREYGETKQLELTGQISIVAAMQAAKTRVQQIVATPDDDDESEPTIQQLTSAAIDADWDDDE